MEQREGIVLAGGLGTRLRSVVSDLPKCMAPVAGRPFLYYLLKYMEVRRFTRVVLALGYMHESVQRWLAGEKWDFEIRCSLEETPLGTGGAVRQALSRTDGDEVYILNPSERFSFETDILQQRVRDCLLTGYASDGYFIDIGIPEDYEKADTDFKTLFPR